MATFDLSKQPNKDPYILWQQVEVKVRNNSASNNVAVVRASSQGLTIQFNGSTKTYLYSDKTSIARLLTRQDAAWWTSLPF